MWGRILLLVAVVIVWLAIGLWAAREDFYDDHR